MDNCKKCGNDCFEVKVLYDYSVRLTNGRADLDLTSRHVSAIKCCHCGTEYFDAEIQQRIKEELS